MSEDVEHELVLPPISEKDNICLPLSVNAVAKYWNIDLPMTEANEIASKYAGMNGSILIEGINLAERHGLSSLILHSSINELKQVIDMGIPPIVILPGLHDVVQHASIISGYDDNEKTIFHYVPEQKPSEEGIQVGVIPEKRFEKLWSEDGCLMVLLGPTDIISSLKSDENKTKSNRLCFESERLSLQKQAQETIYSLKKAIELNPDNSTALCLLGGVLNEQSNPDCVSYYEKSLAKNKNCYLAYRGLGNFYLKNQQFDKSEKNYTRAIEINDNRFGPIYKNRGYVRQQQNKMNEAKEDYQNYIKFTPNAKDRGMIERALNEM
jgi:tetratricopeptide (TPR) repeat protein